MTALVRRLVLLVATLAVASVVSAPPAAAHTVQGTGPTNYLTEITEAPDLPGVSFRVREFGARLEITNDTDTDILVLGYQREPYLRIGSDGVFWNLNSPATYINQTVKTDTEIPSRADAAAAPEWERISDGSRATWHDHRIHWMGSSPPPEVERNRGSEHIIFPSWTVPIEYGGRALTVGGTLRWVPGQSPAPWLLLAAGVALVIGVAAQLVRRHAVGLVRLLTVAVIGLGVWQAAAVAAGSAMSASEAVFRFVVGSLLLGVGWVLGVFGLRLLARGRLDGLYLAFFPALVTLGVGGLGDLDVLSRSQVAFAGGPTLARAVVALVIGTTAGLAAAAFITLRRETGGFAPWISFRGADRDTTSQGWAA